MIGDLPPAFILPAKELIRPAAPYIIRARDLPSHLAMPLPGMPVMAAPKAGLITSISVFSSSISTSGATITAPASIQAGDIIVLAQTAINGAGAGPAAVNPSGFTTIGYDDDLNGSAMLSYKLATGTEGGTSLTGMLGNNTNTKALYVFRPNVPATGLVVGSFPGTMSQGDPTGVNVTAGAVAAPLVVVGSYHGGTGAVTRTFSTTKDAEISAPSPASGYQCWLAYKIYNSSPQDTSIDTGDAGNFNCVHGAYIRPTI